MKYIIDLHTHTISSGHAYSTLEENARSAARNGIKILGMSEHAPSMPGAPHLFFFQNMRIIPAEIGGVKILKGIEVNIMDYKGTLDMPAIELEKMDYVIASLHPPCISPSSMDINTYGLIKIIQNPLINIIGHPDDSRYPLDYEHIVLAAKENNVLLEINNASLDPGGTRENALAKSEELLRLCKKHGVSVILGSDSHISFNIGNFGLCQTLLDKVDFPEALIVNTSEEKLLKYLKK